MTVIGMPTTERIIKHIFLSDVAGTICDHPKLQETFFKVSLIKTTERRQRHMCAYHGVRNVSVSESFAYVLNE